MTNDPNARGGVRRYLDSTKPEEYEPQVGEVNLHQLSLTGLADLYGSDKGTIKHNYTRHYTSLLDELIGSNDRLSITLNVCEFGVACGASLRMWATYLPSSFVYGYDVRKECSLICKDLPNVEVVIDDPRKASLPKEFFDLVIDDASHIAEDIVENYRNTWSAVKSGGFYVVEDLSCTYNKNYSTQYSSLFGVQVRNERSAILNLLDSLLRTVDLRGDVDSLRYFPQLLIIKKL